MADKTKRIDIRVSENDLREIDRLAGKAQMSRSRYLISSALGNQITVIKDGKEIAHQLFKIGSNINNLKILAHQEKIKVVYMDKFTEEVKAVWQSLNLSTGKTRPTQE
ncbi:MAG: type II toxin-antitoxin system HicB family antitoxin [Firmicutes bacterium]|nr:type II toxin-antitoxin system HicB family antitoxin [Bacillota bacterium]